ncbi:glycosyl transferase [Orrella sp. NBD-18]|uniref:Glycosyl transferase n=1 Tax=Sheuella amnicola TaxID=2707330 RepID=A0A6B2R0F2_9BURK|nr:glycosyltransferase [Sheuella amnicola]NDY83498.1 glycosyl transferase [Sheuella amnicola]
MTTVVFAIPHLALTTAGIATFAICLGIVLTKRWHGLHTLDFESGVQKVHAEPTPRIGGLAILIGLAVSLFFTPHEVTMLFGPMLLAALPAFFAGVIEDITKRGRVTERLLATFSSGLLAWWLTGYSLTRIGLSGIDTLLVFLPVSIVFTAFAVGGVANAINIIDGFNGLAGSTILLSLATLSLMSYLSGDAEMAKICFIVGGATFGFLLLNYPSGKIFLGDGGAYLLGFLLGWLAVMVAMRNSGISPWAPMLACGYPIFEVLFSMARRKARTLQLGRPDRLHLHSLVWSRVTRKWLIHQSSITQNAAVCPLMMLYAAIPSALSLLFRKNTATLIVAFIACGLIYALVYARLVHFKWVVPKLRLAN